jgi:hypothetical protein
VATAVAASAPTALADSATIGSDLTGVDHRTRLHRRARRIVVRTDRRRNLRLHRELAEAAAAVVGA